MNPVGDSAAVPPEWDRQAACMTTGRASAGVRRAVPPCTLGGINVLLTAGVVACRADRPK